MKRVSSAVWEKSATELKSAGYDFFNQLGARALADKEQEVWLIVSNTLTGERAEISTRTHAPLPTLSHLWAGAFWCEREVSALAELPLTRRTEKEWPGFADPSGRTRFSPVGIKGGQ